MSRHQFTFLVGSEDHEVVVEFELHMGEGASADCPASDDYAEAFRVISSEHPGLSHEALIDMANDLYQTDMIERASDELVGAY